MKKKYILSTPYIEYEEACIDLFNKMSNDGWELVKVGIFFVFEKTNRKLKYQIDYTQRDTEYNQIIKELGYHYIGSCNTTNFYASEKLDASDLITDPMLLKNEKLKHYLSNKWLFFGTILIMFYLNLLLLRYSYQLYFSDEYYFYLYAHEIPTKLFYTFLSIGVSFYTLLSYKKSKSLLNDTFKYKKFRLFDKFIYYEIIFTFVVGFLMNAYFNGTLFKNLYIVYLFFIYPTMRYLVYYTVPKLNKKISRNIIGTIILVLGLSTSIYAVEYTEKSSYPKDYFEIEDIGEIKKNRYIYEINSFISPTFPGAYRTVYREFRNQEIMDTVISFEMAHGSNFENNYETKIVDYCSYDQEHDRVAFKYERLYVAFSIQNEKDIESKIQQFIDFYKNNSYFK